MIVDCHTDLKDLRFGNKQLPPPEQAKVSGRKYHDLNGNGSRKEGKDYLEGWEIVAKKDSVSKSVYTNANGYYEFVFTGNEFGTWVIKEVLKNDCQQTAPATPGTYTVAVQSGTNEQNKDKVLSPRRTNISSPSIVTFAVPRTTTQWLDFRW